MTDIDRLLEMIKRPGPPLDVHHFGLDENGLVHGISKRNRSVLVMNQTQFLDLLKDANPDQDIHELLLSHGFTLNGPSEK